MSLWLHGKEDFISEAGAMNVWIIKQAADGCESCCDSDSDNAYIVHPCSYQADPSSRFFRLPRSLFPNSETRKGQG
jgi:hypothetical protein